MACSLGSSPSQTFFATIFDESAPYWTTATTNWPSLGEIDIVEGVNDQSSNHSTLHTTSGCTVNAANMHQTGTLATTDCDCQVNGNPDCGVTVNEASNYSPSFNANGGGWYAMERTSSHTSLWFWERNGANVPSDVKNGASTVNPSNWGTPYSNFVNKKWNYGSCFGPENITITSPCGDWAGNVYPSSCPKTCVDHVNQDPAYFQNASWNFANLKAYQ